MRNEISVEPGLPKIVVRPCRRITSRAASRTVRPAAICPLPLPCRAAGSTPVVWLIGADPTGGREIRHRPGSVVFAYRTIARNDRQAGTELGFRAVPGAGPGGHPGVRRREPRAGLERGGAFDRTDAGRGAPLSAHAG